MIAHPSSTEPRPQTRTEPVPGQETIFTSDIHRTYRTRRPVSINNSLCHGLCNYNCRLCGVNKPSYSGPRAFQPREVTETLIRRVQTAAQEGIRIRIIANSGDGEPTLHPEFGARMRMFGDMLRNWNAPVPAPEVSMVSNGSRLLQPGVLEAITENPMTLNLSLPTVNPDAYGELMFGEAARGRQMLDLVMAGIRAVMKLRAEGRLNALHFHISPPDREVVRRDFALTVDMLTSMAREAGLGEVSLVMFPATSNRSGLIRNTIRTVDSYRDLFRAYRGTVRNGVTVRMTTVIKRFFPSPLELWDMIRSFDYPCIWKANFFIAAGGESICCNDQAVRSPMGNILTHTLAELLVAKERHLPGRACAGCDSSPWKTHGSLVADALNLAGRTKYALTRLSRRPETASGRPLDAAPREVPT